MSGKATGKVWDMRLGSGPLKTVLLAYADHADHEGNNMFPSIELIVYKTEYSEATVHRCVKKLIEDGLLIPDGRGPHNTNKFSLGCQSDTLSQRHGVIVREAGGVKNDSQLPKTRESLTPELNGRTINTDNQYLKIIQAQARTHWGNNFGAWHKVEKVLEAATYERTDHTLVISGLGLQAAVYQDRYAETFEHDFFGALNERIKVRFE